MLELLVLHEPHADTAYDPDIRQLGKRAFRLIAPPQSHLLAIAESMTQIDHSFTTIDAPDYAALSNEFKLGDVATFAIVTESPAWTDAFSRQHPDDSPERSAQLMEAQETLRWMLGQTDRTPWALQLIDNNFHEPKEAAQSIIKIVTNGGPLNRELVRTIQRMLVSVESMSPLVNELYYQKINQEVVNS